MIIDHIAISVSSPKDAAEWYAAKFGAKILYSDETWSFIQFENIKLAFIIENQHPNHIAFETDKFDKEDNPKLHRDGSMSVYKKDPWGNYYEFIKY